MEEYLKQVREDWKTGSRCCVGPVKEIWNDLQALEELSDEAISGLETADVDRKELTSIYGKLSKLTKSLKTNWILEREAQVERTKELAMKHHSLNEISGILWEARVGREKEEWSKIDDAYLYMERIESIMTQLEDDKM
ncbi:hypothetical protein CC1G_15650 [Coprinopsis cinerea okayama7|uniref:Uncharacterized protein n=1 Tax=Coprinopsis cinerea (strain Okayama-7 / 130 / ATCC MYA-4618 / FGSC 9003) TaxID=240176 RepID=D6RQB1_COPC7|nr:hypothetical protein CC1G_15650 [Coprinopsis cinerea okayama7\|eukprot:XP_002910221.1 hypothetical protein CC1G_15650 [Coprinopsis cinerea okayama7\